MYPTLKQLLSGNKQSRNAQAARQARLELQELEQRQVPTVNYYGGPLLQNVEVQAVYYGSDWSTDRTMYNQTGSLEDFLSKTAQGSYMDMLANAGYNVGRGSLSRGVIAPFNIDPMFYLQDSQVQSDLQTYINNRWVQSPDSNRLYVVYVEDNVVIQASDGSTSATDFYGYHGNFAGTDANGNAADIRYAIIAYPGGANGSNGQSTLDQMAAVTSHELAEAVTDPDVATNNLGWYDYQRNGEVGDLAAGNTVYLNGYSVQRIVNIKDQPMTPAGATTAEPVSFVLQPGGSLYEYSSSGQTLIASGVASVSGQGIDNQGYAMVDYVTTRGKAYEYQVDQGATFLGGKVKSAVAGQGVSYVLYTSGAVRELHDADIGYTNARWTSVASGIRKIAAALDTQRVNAVDVVTARRVAYQYSDSGTRTLITSGAESVRAAQQGMSASGTTGDTPVTFDISTHTTKQPGPGMAAGGHGSELTANGKQKALGTEVAWISKTRAGLSDEVFSNLTAYQHDFLSRLSFLSVNALAASPTCR
jgi:hypothetical protein